MDHYKNLFYERMIGWKPAQFGSRVHTVFSCTDTLYQYWQSELLAYTYRKVGQPGPLTRLVSTNKEVKYPFSEKTFKATDYSIHPRSGDKYLAYNKPSALMEWLKQVKPKESTIVVIDPDCVFLSKYVGEVLPGKPKAAYYCYMEPGGELGKLLISRHCRRNRELVQSVGIPVVIHRQDLEIVAPRWLEVTREIRDDKECHNAVGWIAEMFGYAIAAAEAGLKGDVKRLCVFPPEDSVDAPFMHYCAASENEAEGFMWHKGIYKPWEQPPMPPPGSPKATLVLAQLLKEAADVYGNAAGVGVPV